MTWHLMAPLGRLNSTDLHIALMFWLLIEKFLAVAVETSAPRSTLAPTVARSNLQIFILEPPVTLITHALARGCPRGGEFVSRPSPFCRRSHHATQLALHIRHVAHRCQAK